MTRARARRLAIALWIAMAVVVWNGLYDLRITLGVRDYLMKQALHDAGRGPAVTIAEAMHATVRDAVTVASLWAAIILGAGLVDGAMLSARRLGARHRPASEPANRGPCPAHVDVADPRHRHDPLIHDWNPRASRRAAP